MRNSVETSQGDERGGDSVRKAISPNLRLARSSYPSVGNTGETILSCPLKFSSVSTCASRLDIAAFYRDLRMRRAVLSSKDLGAYAAGHDVARRGAFRRHGAWRAQGDRRAACHATAHGASAPRAGITFLRSAVRIWGYNDGPITGEAVMPRFQSSSAREIGEVLE